VFLRKAISDAKDKHEELKTRLRHLEEKLYGFE